MGGERGQRLHCNFMTFIYIACKFYKISNVVACESLILNCNGNLI